MKTGNTMENIYFCDWVYRKRLKKQSMWTESGNNTWGWTNTRRDVTKLVRHPLFVAGTPNEESTNPGVVVCWSPSKLHRCLHMWWQPSSAMLYTSYIQLCSRTARAVAKGMVAAHSQTSPLWICFCRWSAGGSTVFPLCESLTSWWVQQSSRHPERTTSQLKGHSDVQGWDEKDLTRPILLWQLLQSTMTVSTLGRKWHSLADAESIITRVGQ